MTRYIKTTTTEFEQFDGSDEMFKKYGIRPDMGTANVVTGKPLYFLMPTLEGELSFEIGDWIATGVNGEHWAVKDEIFKKTYKKLPVIPECVNYAIEWFEQNDNGLGQIFRNVYEDLADNWHESPQLKVAEMWIISYPDEFARAWLVGYEVADY